jgi:hypothetical protein
MSITIKDGRVNVTGWQAALGCAGLMFVVLVPWFVGAGWLIERAFTP